MKWGPAEFRAATTQCSHTGVGAVPARTFRLVLGQLHSGSFATCPWHCHEPIQPQDGAKAPRTIPKRRRILTQEAPFRSKTVQVDGEKLVELRTRKNWTQEKLADKAIVSVRTVQNIERGRPTQRSTLAKLAGALGVSARDLMPVVAPETTPDPRLSTLTEADAKFTTAGGGVDYPQDPIGAGPDVDRVVPPLVSKPAQNKIPQISGPSRAARRFRFPTIVVLFLAGAAGLVTWFLLGAVVFTPLQRYYWDEYLNTEMFQGTGGDYRLLEVVDRRGEHRIAIDSDVAPAAVHGPDLVPFVLSAQARHSGATDLAVKTVHYGSAQMHQVLATSIYDGRSVMELSAPAWGVGLGVFALRIFLLVRHRNRSRRLQVAKASEAHG